MGGPERCRMDDATFADLARRYERVVALGDAEGLLAWDQQVTMPPEGTPARSTQRSTLSSLEHDLLTDPDTRRDMGERAAGVLTAGADMAARYREALEEELLGTAR